jgi:hypothetical protein
MLAYARSSAAAFNWGRLAIFAALFIAAIVITIEPAHAAFNTFSNRITTQTTAATQVAQRVLYFAAGLSLLIGVAPMLWGQVKVKWIVTCLVAAVVFALIPTLINAFAGGNVVPETGLPA